MLHSCSIVALCQDRQRHYRTWECFTTTQLALVEDMDPMQVRPNQASDTVQNLATQELATRPQQMRIGVVRDNLPTA